MQDDELFAIKDRAAERQLAVSGVTAVGVVRSLPDLSGLTYPRLIDRLAAD